jgi:septum formation protein
MASSAVSPRIILASASRARHDMLRSAGIAFDVVPADIDEAAVREALLAEDADCDPSDIAEVLACAKATQVSVAHPEAVVIGSDQILSLGPKLFSKPGDGAGVRATLDALNGKTHQLHSAVAVAQGGEVGWSHLDSADLTMRHLSQHFLDAYVERAGSGVLGCVGAYQIEGLGAQLFERIEGDHFTILGMPLLPLLGELRVRKAILS